MKKSIIIAIILMIAGGITVLFGFISAGFSLKGFSNEKFEEIDHKVDGDFSGISIATHIYDVHLLPSDNGECHIVGKENNIQKIEYKIDGGILTVKTVDHRKWYDYLSFNLFTPACELKIYLPENAYTSLTTATNTGDIKISADLSFTRASLATDTGDIDFRAQVEESLDLATSTGNVLLENVKSSGEFTLKCDTGDIELHGVEANSILSKGTTGDIMLKNVYVQSSLNIMRDTGDVELTSVVAGAIKIETDTGDVELNSSDAQDIHIETDTGDVEGTLLTEKIFVTNSSTGRIRVPQTTAGGTCKITTSTGDIHITID